MAKVLGYDISDFDLVKYENIPTMRVMYWSSDNSYSLAPKWSPRQTMYDSIFSTDDGYSKEDLQDMADEFNNDYDLAGEYNKARLLAFNSLIIYNKNKIKEGKEDLDKLIAERDKLNE